MTDAEPGQTSTVGTRMAAARQALGFELEDIAERTRIPLRHLQAIEHSNFAALPASTYSAGFVKTYARVLGLDADEIAAEFRVERGDALAPRPEYTPFEPADPARVPSRLLATIALVTALLLMLVYLIWRGGGNDEIRQQQAAGTAPEAIAPLASGPVVSAGATPRTKPAAAVTGSEKVVLIATDIVWLKVSEKDGPTLFMGQLNPGDRYDVPANAADPRLLTGRPQALQAQIGTRLIPALGTPERTISDVSLKAPALIARADAAPIVPPRRSPEAEAAPASPPTPTPAENVAEAPGEAVAPRPSP